MLTPPGYSAFRAFYEGEGHTPASNIFHVLSFPFSVPLLGKTESLISLSPSDFTPILPSHGDQF